MTSKTAVFLPTHHHPEELPGSLCFHEKGGEMQLLQLPGATSFAERDEMASLSNAKFTLKKKNQTNRAVEITQYIFLSTLVNSVKNYMLSGGGDAV